MAAAPRTIEQCDCLLTITHNRYLALIDQADLVPDTPEHVETRAKILSEAAEHWIQLHELLDVRIHLPQQRKPT